MKILSEKNDPHIIKARVWLWQGDSPWHFITIEKEQATEIKNDYHWPRRGFGSIPVKVTVGMTTWQTSVFPEKGGTYLLPIKKDVRQKEGIAAGNTIKISLTVIT